MNEERVREIVRQFPENGLKQVLISAGTLRELLGLGRATMVPRLDFAGLQVDPTTYVTAGYRHVSSDLVLSVPLLPSRKGGRRKRLLVTILIELQMQPDRLMLTRGRGDGIAAGYAVYRIHVAAGLQTRRARHR